MTSELDGGAIELIGYDEASGDYTSHLYDSQGDVSVHSLTSSRVTLIKVG